MDKSIPTVPPAVPAQTRPDPHRAFFEESVLAQYDVADELSDTHENAIAAPTAEHQAEVQT